MYAEDDDSMPQGVQKVEAFYQYIGLDDQTYYRK